MRWGKMEGKHPSSPIPSSCSFLPNGPTCGVPPATSFSTSWLNQRRSIHPCPMTIRADPPRANHELTGLGVRDGFILALENISRRYTQIQKFLVAVISFRPTSSHISRRPSIRVNLSPLASHLRHSTRGQKNSQYDQNTPPASDTKKPRYSQTPAPPHKPTTPPCSASASPPRSTPAYPPGTQSRRTRSCPPRTTCAACAASASSRWPRACTAAPTATASAARAGSLRSGTARPSWTRRARRGWRPGPRSGPAAGRSGSWGWRRRGSRSCWGGGWSGFRRWGWRAGWR